MIKFILLFSRHGLARLQKFYVPYTDTQRKRLTKEVTTTVLARTGKKCNFVDYAGDKIVYKRYASLYFAFCIEPDTNELLTLESIHRLVEFLDKYFGNVCELDVIFNFEKAHFILDEFIIGGEIQETSVKVGIQAVESQDGIMEREIEEASQLFPSLNKSARNNISSSGVHSNTFTFDNCEAQRNM